MNIPTKDKKPATRHKIPIVILFSITIISMSLLAFEISLTRLLSIMLSYHYVYGVTSLAMLGSGIGGFMVHYFGNKKKDIDLKQLCDKLVLQLSLTSICMIVSVLIVIQISRVTTGSSLVFGILLCSPFFFGGMFLASLFKVFPVFSGKLYFADLSGAALGCALVVFSLNMLGDTESVLLFSFLISAMSILMAVLCKAGKKSLVISGAGAIFLVVLILISLGRSALFQIPIGNNNEKEIYDSLHIFDGEIIETRHSAFGRTDVIQYEDIQAHMDIYLDGTAGTPMYKFNGDISKPNQEVEELKTFPGYFPLSHFSPEEKDNALIIGSGGGRDVLLALLAGVGKITAVEVNPDLADLVNHYSWYNGGIYSTVENVDLIVDEGRSFLRSAGADKFDIIMMTLPRTNTSRSVEGYALTENYLFTTNSIAEYLDRINENGHLVVVANDDAEILRLLTLTLTVFEQKGVNVQDAMDHVYILGSSPNPVFVLRNGVFGEDLANKIYNAAINENGYNPSTSFFPELSDSDQYMNPIFLGLDHGQLDIQGLTDMVEELGYDIRPVSDNDPFFYKLTTGLPESFITVLIFAVILIAVMIIALLAFEPGDKSADRADGKRKARKARHKISLIAIFCMLGIGYMAVEISLIQKFVFFLGKPVLSLTVILFSVLLGSGTGSFISNSVKNENIIKMITRITVAIALLLIFYNFILIPVLFHYFLGIEFLSRTIISIVIILPLSIIMGMPFPLMIREMHELADDRLIPWMWGINAVSSVFGSVLAMALAISLGYNQAIAAAASCYLLIYIISRYFRRIERQRQSPAS